MYIYQLHKVRADYQGSVYIGSYSSESKALAKAKSLGLNPDDVYSCSINKVKVD